ncbi:hypothetical protein EDB82DRAFT_574760 [Fusarium venenatum]|uniref:uncharacterized protein n=1 Tax=Fusarium venenatum TaxID=56646 RepID=UPI001DDF65FB|nr:hypothetical protein EDB82DRAFT_574760 [Fusarium venenatum]
MMQNIISQVPSHFTKVFYIPKHNENVSNFAVYDISEQYSDKIGKLPMGSEDYKVELCILPKPNGEHVGDNARFLVDVGSDNTSMSVRERTLGQDPVEAQVSLPKPQNDEYFVHTHTGSTSARSSGRLAFPLPEKHMKKEIIRYPYLAFTDDIFSNNHAEHSQYEWQVHPDEKGALRYELVNFEEKSSEDRDHSILAIYHHHGFENDLPTSHSHGVLLLPSTSTSEFDISVLSSLLAILSAVRQQARLKKRSRIRCLMGCI